MVKTKEDKVLDDILAPKPTDKDFISELVQSQEDLFPQASDIEVTYKYQDPFEIPKWCNQKDYAFAWADIRDDITRHRVFEVQYFKLVNRMSPCIIKEKMLHRDFRDHGAVERQGVFLIYRPIELDEKLRTYPVLRHAEMVSAIRDGKSGQGYEISQKKGEDTGSNIEVIAAEEAGTEGIKMV
jgi:hypothetical protein